MLNNKTFTCFSLFPPNNFKGNDKNIRIFQVDVIRYNNG